MAESQPISDWKASAQDIIDGWQNLQAFDLEARRAVYAESGATILGPCVDAAQHMPVIVASLQDAVNHLTHLGL
jgi:hypothetical protein